MSCLVFFSFSLFFFSSLLIFFIFPWVKTASTSRAQTVPLGAALRRTEPMTGLRRFRQHTVQTSCRESPDFWTLFSASPTDLWLPPDSLPEQWSHMNGNHPSKCRWSEGFPSRPAPVDSWPCSLPVEAGSRRNLWTLFHISQPLEPPAADRLFEQQETMKYIFQTKLIPSYVQ